MKLELAQFAELEAFSQFASDLDASTQAQLARGQRLRQILKQPENSPLGVWEQVAIAYAGLNGYIDKVPVDKATDFAEGLREYLKTNKPKYVEILVKDKALTDEAETLLKEGINEFSQTFA